MSEHIFTGPLRSRTPEKFGTILGWYHIVCYTDQRVPMGVAATREALEAGGGDRIWPGASVDLYAEGVWLAPGLMGGLAVVSIERREGPTYVNYDVLGEIAAISVFKGGTPRELEQNKWHTIVSNVIGMLGLYVRVEGGTVYLDSHTNTTLPPHEQTETGAGWQLHENDPWIFIPGNLNLYAYTYEPNVTLHFAKICRGADIGRRPQAEPGEVI